jgi:type 1 glutamine amidotransferase
MRKTRLRPIRSGRSRLAGIDAEPYALGTRTLGLVSLSFAMLLAGAASVGASQTASTPRILVFSKTAGFRHDSIPAAIRAVRTLGARNGIAVDATEDAGSFSPSNLTRYDAVAFLLTTGDVLDAGQQRAFERYVAAGHGFAGVHSATDTEYGWPWYHGLVGATFKSHPAIQRAVVEVENALHPSTVGLPRRWSRTDEWYGFKRNPRRAVRVLATVDESTYAPGTGAMGSDHPIAWAHEYRGGRAWYTAGGHTGESYSEPQFLQHLAGGIRYAAGLSPPRIVAVKATVVRRRVQVRLSYRSCRPCSGVLLVRVRGRWSRWRIGLSAQVGSARTRRLPAGRWPFSVVLEDRPTGLRDSARRSIHVR